MLYTIISGHKEPKENVFGICSQNSKGVPQALKTLRDKILWVWSLDAVFLLLNCLSKCKMNDKPLRIWILKVYY